MTLHAAVAVFAIPELTEAVLLHLETKELVNAHCSKSFSHGSQRHLQFKKAAAKTFPLFIINS